jgi:hypothetical protein
MMRRYRQHRVRTSIDASFPRRLHKELVHLRRQQRRGQQRVVLLLVQRRPRRPDLLQGGVQGAVLRFKQGAGGARARPAKPTAVLLPLQQTGASYVVRTL